MPSDDDASGAVVLEAAHRSQPRLHLAMAAASMQLLGVLLSAVPGRRQRLLQHRRVHWRPVGDNLDWRRLDAADGPLEEPAGCLTSQCVDMNTSITWPNWSMARYT
jgi:hypothetical protein